MFTSFIYPLVNFQQPGIFWPELADYKPLQIVAAICLLANVWGKSDYPRLNALKQPTIKWMMIFLLVQPLSVYRTGVGEMITELGAWSVYAIFVAVSVAIINSPQALRSYVWGMMCGSMFIIVFGIYAVLNGLPQAFGGRAGAYGMYENHNDYTFLIIQNLPFMYMFLRMETGFLKRLALLGSLGACLWGVALSLSRGGMMALVIEIVLIVWLTMTKRSRMILLPLVIVMGAGAIGYQYAKRAENSGEGYTAEDAETSRFELWRAGRKMIEAHPFLGVGTRRFGEYAPDYAEISHDNRGKNAHNTFVDILACTGFFGFIAFTRMLWCAQKEMRDRIEDKALGDGWIHAVKMAAFIALVTEIFRGMFDAKSHDWSFYTVATLAAVTGAMARHLSPPAAPDQPKNPQRQPLPRPTPAAASGATAANRVPRRTARD